MPSLLVRCDACRKRPQEKPAQVTAAWNDQDRHRHAYRQRLCVDCYAVRVLAYEKAIAADEPLTCPACGINTDRDYQAVWVTAFLPGVGKIRHEFPFCGEHFDVYRQWAMENAERLEDREPQSRGQAPGAPPPVSPWAALGLAPDE